MLRGRHLLAVICCALFLVNFSSVIGAQGDESAFVRAESLVVVVNDNVSHDSQAYTQGLEFYEGRLFESTGVYGESSLREVNLSTGEVIRSVNLSEDEFGEGITFVDDQIFQLTWKQGIAYRYDVETFEVVQTYNYEGQGWGLAYDGNQLIMSDGSDVLQFRNATTFEVESTLDVTLNNESLGQLNELEMYDGLLLANVYQTEQIVGIDLSSGVVVWNINASGLKTEGGEVLNGIAHDPSTNSLWITGKYWSKMYNISFDEPERIPEPELVEQPEEAMVTEIDSVFSNVILASMMFLLIALWAMKLKDGGVHPPPEGGLP
jgi:glutamine cyclotransferase